MIHGVEFIVAELSHGICMQCVGYDMAHPIRRWLRLIYHHLLCDLHHLLLYHAFLRRLGRQP